MRTINLNGYIDEEVWYGDEITPAMLHDALYGENSEFSDDVRIILNSYGGSCNAAVRMHDDIRAYPGRVHLVISGTAASAATVLSAAADTLEMTPGSLYMIHDPSTVAWGNERDFGEAIALLKACKESILNIYSRRSPIDRGTLAAMMTATTRVRHWRRALSTVWPIRRRAPWTPPPCALSIGRMPKRRCGSGWSGITRSNKAMQHKSLLRKTRMSRNCPLLIIRNRHPRRFRHTKTPAFPQISCAGGWI